jgi:two-component system, NarL family, invasion response regulator UvrY
MIRILIADDHAVVREGIKRIINGAEDLQVVGEAASGPELLAAVAAEPCDVVLTDLAMPGLAGLEFIEALHRIRPGIPVLVLSMYPEDQYAVRALRAGASGYLHKSGVPQDLLAAIRQVSAGRRYITPVVAECLAAEIDDTAVKPPHEQLSNREYQVLCLIASGKSVGDIARELTLSVKTVSTFRRRVLEKLHLRHNAELTRYAIQHRLVE